MIPRRQARLFSIGISALFFRRYSYGIPHASAASSGVTSLTLSSVTNHEQRNKVHLEKGGMAVTPWTLRAKFAVLFLAFPIVASADWTSMSFGTTTGSSMRCTNAFSGYWGYTTLPLTRISSTGPDGSPSTAIRALGVSPYSISNGGRPNICVQFDAPNPGSYSAWVDARYGYNGEYIATVYVTGTYDPPAGWVNPKYMILGVLYAPPGNRSSVSYNNNTVVGSTTSVSDSFQNAANVTLTMSSDINIFGFGVSETSTASYGYTQQSENSSSVAINQTNSKITGLAGFSDPNYGVNHDYDQIVVWLNPILKFRAGTNRIHWTGFAWDLNDPAHPDMDVIHVPVGCLNGHFSAPHAMAPTCQAIISGPLARTWAQTNVDGSGPGLTGTAPCIPGSGTDLCNLLAADPFSDPTYALTPAPPDYLTSADGRFTACHNSLCQQTIAYQPYITNSYSEGYSTTATQGQSAIRTYSVGWSLDRGLKFSVFDYNFTGNLKYSQTLTWRHQFSKSTNNSNAQVSQFSIIGPDPGYAGPMQFVVYQDNLYGTFVFNAQ
jgi:hypothetical protein